MSSRRVGWRVAGWVVGLQACLAWAGPWGHPEEIRAAVLQVKITSPAEGAVVGNVNGPAISVCVLDKEGHCASGGNYRYVLNLNGVEYSGSGGSVWTYVPSPHLAGGSYSAFVKASPVLGSGSSSATSPLVHFAVDTVAPNTSISGMLPGPATATRRASFAFTSDEAGSRFQCSLDAPGEAADEPFADCTSPKSYTGLADGAYTFLVRAVDAAGNRDQTPATHSWTVSPLDTRITQAPPATTPSPLASFSFTSTGGALFECALDAPGDYQDEAFAPCVSPKNYSDLGEGAYAFSVRALDLQGNRDDTPATHAWSVDSSRPDVHIDSGPARWVRVKTAELRFSSTRSDVYFECELDGRPLLPCRSPVSLSTPEDEADHVFSVRSVNGAGKKSATDSREWSVDTTPPVVRITSPFDEEVVTVLAPGFGGTVDDPESTVKVSVDDVEVGETVADAKGKWFVRLSRELRTGSHTVRARALNRANGEGRSGLQRFSVDTSLPDTVILLAPPKVDDATTASFEFESSKGGTQFQCQLDLAPGFTACEQRTRFVDLADGDHALRVRAVDAEGNVDPTPEVYQWTLLRAPPPPDRGEPGPAPSGVIPSDDALVTGGGVGCAASGMAPSACWLLLGAWGLWRRRTARPRA